MTSKRPQRGTGNTKISRKSGKQPSPSCLRPSSRHRHDKITGFFEASSFVSSNTHLAVLRGDWRVVKAWDALLEGHYLSNSLAGDHRWGGLAAIYRHISNNAKIGVGYRFSDFSSDLGDQSYTSKGHFINLLGKY